LEWRELHVNYYEEMTRREGNGKEEKGMENKRREQT